jgi:hypothetical protein
MFLNQGTKILEDNFKMLNVELMVQIFFIFFHNLILIRLFPFLNSKFKIVFEWPLRSDTENRSLLLYEFIFYQTKVPKKAKG